MTENVDSRNASVVSSTSTTVVKLSGAFQSLPETIQRAISEQGYERPTPIQEQSIAPLLAGRDLLGSAQTGTGKTAAFTLPLLAQLSESGSKPIPHAPFALILAPTRELAAQIGDSLFEYGRHTRARHAVVYGGVSQYTQVKALRRGVHTLVATPGRLLDLVGQGHIDLSQVGFFVLDEVDRMLDMGFIPDIERILNEIPEERQTAFFSATMAPKIEHLANSMLTNPERVTIEPDKPAVERIDQKALYVGKRDKDALLISLMQSGQIEKAIIFTQMKHVANRVSDKLYEAGIRGTAIHGNKSQAARTKALDGFKRGRFTALVATDVAARGLDVDDITHVINYDLPTEAETYVHRIGRTGRAGASGFAISFCTTEERGNLRDIVRLLGREVPADIEHEYHCDRTFKSTQSSAKKRGFEDRESGGRPGPRNRSNGKRRNGERSNSGRPESRGNGRPRRDRDESGARDSGFQAGDRSNSSNGRPQRDRSENGSRDFRNRSEGENGGPRRDRDESRGRDSGFRPGGGRPGGDRSKPRRDRNGNGGGRDSGFRGEERNGRGQDGPRGENRRRKPDSGGKIRRGEYNRPAGGFKSKAASRKESVA